MQSRVLTAALLVLSAMNVCAAHAASESDRIEADRVLQPSVLAAGVQAPSWVGTTLIDDATFNFPEDLAGRPAVLVFWASWCPYSRAFLPYLEALQWDYEEAGVKIITLNAKQRDRGDPRAYARSLGFPLMVIAEADPIAADYDVETVPGVFVVDGNGGVVYRRQPTDLPAGSGVASQWDREVRSAIDGVLSSS